MNGMDVRREDFVITIFLRSENNGEGAENPIITNPGDS